MSDKDLIIADEVVMHKIYLIRNHKVMLDRDLAELYGVTTGNLNKAVNRNIKRFPRDFMFQLTKKEFENLIFQIGTSSWGGTRKLPKAFTEQGVAMLSSVLHSERAINVNIQIIRIFNRLRTMIFLQKDLLIRMNELESKMKSQNKDIKQIFAYLRQLITENDKPKRRIGFRRKDESDL
jgi:hypothetical protein